MPTRFEITEEARVGEGTTNSGRTLMAGGKDLTVKVKDLAGNYLQLYKQDGTAIGISSTTDAFGRVDGPDGNGVWVNAPDYDLEFWDGLSLSYTQRFRPFAGTGIFHVHSYGAVGDGTTNDRTAIDAAVSAAGAAGGGVVLFPRNTGFRYTGGNLIIQNSNVVLEGEGASSFLDIDGIVALGLATGSAISNVGIRNMRINRRDATANAAVLIRITDKAFVENCIIDSASGGIWIGNATYPTTPLRTRIVGNVVTAADNAIFSDRGTDNPDNVRCLIEGNWITQNGALQPGIEIWLAGSTVANNFIVCPTLDGGAGGITIGRSPYTKALGNYIQGFSYGIEVGNVDKGCAVIGNIIRDCGIGVALTGTVGGTIETDLPIIGNNISLTDSYAGTTTPIRGIHLQGFSSATVTGNVIRFQTTLAYTDVNSRKHVGIQASDDFKRLVVSGCQFINLDKGIVGSVGSPHIAVAGCMFDNVNRFVDDTGATPRHMFSTCVFHNVKGGLVATALHVSNCTFANEADFVAVSKAPFQCANANQVVVHLRGCRFSNVLDSSLQIDANYAETTGTWDRCKIEIRDDGYKVWNVTNWSDFNTIFTNASVTVPLNTNIFAGSTNVSYVKTNNGVIGSGTAAPASGTWAVGDKIYHSTPVAAGNIGWVCTTAGTPGTWKTFGTIAA